MSKPNSSIFFILAALSAFYLRAAAPASAVVEEIGVEAYFQQLGLAPETQILDVRPRGYGEIAYIKGSVNIPLDELSGRIGELDMKKPIIVFCQTGGNSAAAAEIISGHNPAGLAALRGGIAELLRFLSTEPEEIKRRPEMKSLFDKVRGVLSTRRATVGLPFPAPPDGGTASTLSLGEYVGRPALLVFMNATDMNQAEQVVAAKQKLENVIPGLAFVVVAVHRRNVEMEPLKNYFFGKDFNSPVYFDLNSEYFNIAGLRGLPSFNLIDGKGALRIMDARAADAPIAAYDSRTLEELALVIARGELPPYPFSDGDLAERRQAALVGKQASDFILKDTGGGSVRLSTFSKDSYVLLIFGSAACPYSKQEILAAGECGNIIGDGAKPVKTIAVLAAGKPDMVSQSKEFAAQNGVKFPVLLDEMLTAFNDYVISSTPVWWVIDDKGIIRARESGYYPDTCSMVAEIVSSL